MSSITVQELPEAKAPIDWKRVAFIITGLALFALIYYCPAWPDAIDPKGEHFVLSKEAKGARIARCSDQLRRGDPSHSGLDHRQATPKHHGERS